MGINNMSSLLSSFTRRGCPHTEQTNNYVTFRLNHVFSVKIILSYPTYIILPYYTILPYYIILPYVLS